MTAGAWAMLIGTWSVVIFFAGRFFYKVATLPTKDHDDD